MTDFDLTDEQMREVAKRIVESDHKLAALASDAPGEGVRQYVGARYVPIFANPLEWTDTRGYEALTIVTHQGNTYTSAQIVPVGIDISNTDFWVLTGNYNAQVEAYRQEVQAVAKQLDDLQTDIMVNTADIAKINQKLALKDSMVVFGDSFSVYDKQWSLGTWWTYVSEWLHEEVHNYAVIGAGLLYNSNLLSTQVETATADDSYDHGTVKHVFIMSGCNDYLQLSSMTVSQVSAAAVSLVNSIKATFPNAQINWIQNGWPSSPWSTGPGNLQNKGFLTTYYNGLYQASQGIEFGILNLSQVLRLSTSYVHNEHPSLAGAQLLGSCVCEWMRSGTTRKLFHNNYLHSVLGSDWLGTSNFAISTDEIRFFEGTARAFIAGIQDHTIPANTANAIELKRVPWLLEPFTGNLFITSTHQPVGVYTYIPQLNSINYVFYNAVSINTSFYMEYYPIIWGLGI